MRQMQHLKHFQFGHTWYIEKLELKYVSMCLSQLQTLSTVGRNLKYKFENVIGLHIYFWNFYHRLWEMDGAKYPFLPDNVQLALEELCAPGKYWHLVDFNMLPKITRLTIIQHEFPDTSDPYPDTVTELSVYNNMYKPHNILSVLKPQLRSLTLYNCNWQNFPTGGILAMCPNLEELNICFCSYNDLSAFSLFADTRRCLLRTLTINLDEYFDVPDGMLYLLLQAPLLEHVKIHMPEVKATEVQNLVEQVRTGRILQKLSLCYLWCKNTEALKLAIQAFCPNPAIDFNGPNHAQPPCLSESN
jgi:hypothetical protein